MVTRKLYSPLCDNDKDRIERREYKYLTDEATARDLREALRPFCRLDMHAARQPEGRYLISSLYFDTPMMSLYVANQRELIDRFKLRVRHYPQDEDGPLFFEVKRRVNDVILKTRGRVPRARWVDLIAEPYAGISDEVARSSYAAVERFLALVHTYHARPVTVVRYEREPWVSQIDDYARVTIDRRIVSQVQEGLSLDVDPCGWRNMDNPQAQQSLASMTVIELKFTSTVPRWMMHIVQSFDLLRSSFSKYGTSIQAWHQAPQLFSLRPGVAL